LLKRVYHFVNCKYGLDNIRRRRLKVANINELNDPFEFLGVASSSPEIDQAFAQMKVQLAQDRGLLCFSDNWSNPVQWGHYADCHRGLCLGFDVTAQLTQVTYTSERIAWDGVLLKGNNRAEKEKFMMKVLSTKFSHWSYESEHRLFVRLETKDKKTDLYFFDFSEEVVLREVIVGLNSTLTPAKLHRALGALAAEVEIFKARPASRAFEIEMQKWEEEH
jgi:Protein of unknown function (DUF2971)